MTARTNRTCLLHTALLVMVLAGIGHIHSHICLDGQEPATLVHFENLGEHPEHADDARHSDYEQELSPQLIAGKLLKPDLLPNLLPALITELTQNTLPGKYSVSRQDRYFSPPLNLFPPTRAPPRHTS